MNKMTQEEIDKYMVSDYENCDTYVTSRVRIYFTIICCQKESLNKDWTQSLGIVQHT